METPADLPLRQLLAEDADRGWREFVDRYTPTLLALIERAGLRDPDEAMEVYALVCERLAERGCARLRRYDPVRGPLGAWLAVVVRRVIVDWVRARAGRRRLFGAIRRLSAFHQRVFELYFWDERAPAEIAEEMAVRERREVALGDVLTALDDVHAVLSQRHRSELLSAAARARHAASLDAALEDGAPEPVDERADLEVQVERGRMQAAFEAALGELAPEDAAIVRLRYVEGLSLAGVRRALHLETLTESRVRAIVERLGARLAPSSARSRLRPVEEPS